MESEEKNQAKASNWGILYFIAGCVIGGGLMCACLSRQEARPTEIALDMNSFDAMASLRLDILDMGKRLDRAADAIDYLRKRIGIAPGTVAQALSVGAIGDETPETDAFTNNNAASADEQATPFAE